MARNTGLLQQVLKSVKPVLRDKENGLMKMIQKNQTFYERVKKSDDPPLPLPKGDKILICWPSPYTDEIEKDADTKKMKARGEDCIKDNMFWGRQGRNNTVKDKKSVRRVSQEAS